MKLLKRLLPEVLVLVLFAGISFAYFFVPVMQGKVLYRHDASAGVGAGQEAKPIICGCPRTYGISLYTS